MDRVVTTLGLSSSAVVIVPKALEEIEKNVTLVVAAVQKPSILMYDITKGAYSHIVTISDLIAVVATVCSLIFVTIAVNNWLRGYKPKRRKEDSQNSDRSE